MFESAYRQRLDADLARWQADRVITAATVDAIRAALPPAPKSINIPTVIGILGGLLIAAAFLAFVAANWTAIARPARFLVLLAGIAGAYGLGAWFDRSNRPYLADISATVGSIVFGASIALVGQMYHLSDDFAGGLMLWALGALIAAALPDRAVRLPWRSTQASSMTRPGRVGAKKLTLSSSVIGTIPGPFFAMAACAMAASIHPLMKPPCTTPPEWHCSRFASYSRVARPSGSTRPRDGFAVLARV